MVSETMNVAFQTTGRSRSGRIHGFRSLGNSALRTVPKGTASFQVLRVLNHEITKPTYLILPRGATFIPACDLNPNGIVCIHPQSSVVCVSHEAYIFSPDRKVHGVLPVT